MQPLIALYFQPKRHPLWGLTVWTTRHRKKGWCGGGGGLTPFWRFCTHYWYTPETHRRSQDRMSVPDTWLRPATLGEPVIIPTDSRQLACPGSINDADYIIQNEVLLRKGVCDATSLSLSVFNDCDTAMLNGPRPNVVLAGNMSKYDVLHRISSTLGKSRQCS